MALACADKVILLLAQAYQHTFQVNQGQGQPQGQSQAQQSVWQQAQVPLHSIVRRTAVV